MDNATNLVKWFEELILMVKEGIEPAKAGSKVEAVIEWARLCLQLEELMPGRVLGGVTLVKLVVKEDSKQPRRAMLVAMGTKGKEKVVTFHSGPLNADLFASFLRRGHAKKLNWKVDTPYEGKFEEDDEYRLPSLDGL